MAALRSRVKTTGLLSFLLVIQTAGVCRADDCGPAAYAYDQRVVFYRCDKSGTLVLPAVVLELQETGDFRYELVCRSKKRVGEATHGQYLRKVDKASQRTVSELALGGQIETID